MEGKTRRGISLRTINIIMIIIAAVVIVVILVLLLNVQKRYSQLQTNTEVYIDCLNEAPNLNRGSDYLTQQVRSFAVTGQREYVDNFFEEVNVTRRRNKSIEFLEPYMEGTEALGYLESAMESSNRLMEIEYYSMVLQWEADGLDKSEMPAELKDIEISTEDQALSAEEKHQKAVAILFNSTYQNYKDSISGNVDSCLNALTSNMEQEQQTSYRTLNRMMIVLFVMIIIMLLVVLAVIFITLELVMRPMMRATEFIRGQQTLPVKGASEMQYLAEAYNDIFEKTRKKHDALQQTALHDALTGLFNRAGYEQLITELDEDALCLLLVDVDKFKGVNDQYGHDVGDLVLKNAANILRHQFRADDLIFRFGGDEFAVIMRNTGPELTDLIKIKIGNANKQLTSDSKMPPVSFSVGAAFGSTTVTDELFKRADVALYNAKNKGGCQVAFSE